MMLTVQFRDNTGKGVAGKIRKNNRIPGILYGRGYSPKPVEIDARMLQKALLLGAGEAHLIDLVIEGAGEQMAEKALIKAIQRHPVTDRVEHVDFYRVVMTEKIEVDVQLVLAGSPVGIKRGGVLEKRLDTIRVRCLPDRIPEKFSLDVADMEVGQSRHVSDLKAPEGVTILNHPDQALAVVTEVKIVEETPVAAAAVTAEGAAGAAPAAGAATVAGADSKEKKPAESEKKEGAKEKQKGKG